MIEELDSFPDTRNQAALHAKSAWFRCVNGLLRTTYTPPPQNSERVTVTMEYDGQVFITNALQTLDLQRSSLRQGLYDKNSKFMPIKKI
jgi:hypothetical protein